MSGCNSSLDQWHKRVPGERALSFALSGSYNRHFTAKAGLAILMHLENHTVAKAAKSKSFGFGIIGCGMIASFHAKAIADIRGTRLVACFDAVPAAADRLAAAQGCRAYYKLDEMLADPEVEVVTIGTPSGAHLEPALAAARAGKHVIVEKPLEITLKRCDQIIRECEKNKVKLSAIFPSRFHRSSVDMKRAVDDGRFGRLTLGESYVKWFRTQAYYDSGACAGPGNSTAAAPS